MAAISRIPDPSEPNDPDPLRVPLAPVAEFVDQAEASRRFGLNVRTIRRAAQEGRLPRYCDPLRRRRWLYSVLDLEILSQPRRVDVEADGS